MLGLFFDESLLVHAGGDPIPKKILAAAQAEPLVGAATAARESWWDRIVPEHRQSVAFSPAADAGAATAATAANAAAAGGAATDEEALSRAISAVSAAPGMPADWSLFDDCKLTVAMKLLASAAVFLRLACSDAVRVNSSSNGGGGSSSRKFIGLLGLNFPAVAAAFNTCAALALNLSASSGGDPASSEWMRSSQPVLPAGGAGTASFSFSTSDVPAAGVGVDASAGFQGHGAYRISSASAAATTPRRAGETGGAWGASGAPLQGAKALAEQLQQVAEHLICVVYVVVMETPSQQQLEAWQQPLSAVLKTANAHPAHSFIRQVARWIRDQLRQ